MMLQEVGRLHAAKAAPKLLIHCTRSSIHLNAIHESAVLRKKQKSADADIYKHTVAGRTSGTIIHNWRAKKM
jgi:hypothetical protein